MNAGRYVWLVIVGRRQWHIGHIENEISDLTKELVLIGVPLLASSIEDC